MRYGTLQLIRFWRRAIVGAAIAFSAFSPRPANGGSFALNEQSVSGLGVAFAGGAAQAEDVSTIFFNPAGIALLKQGELQFAAQLVAPQANFTNQGSSYKLPNTPINGLPLSGGNGGDGGGVHVLPNIYLSQPVFRSPQYGDLTVGIGLSVPFGLETDYDPGWVGRYVALRSKLSTFDIQPTIAYRLFDKISLGASLDIQYASGRFSQAIDYGLLGSQVLGQFEQALPALLAARGVPPAAIPGVVSATNRAFNNAGFVPGGRDGISEISGNDWSLGFTLGAIFEYWKGDDNAFFQDGRFGVSYRSGISHSLKGPAQFRNVPAITAPGAPVSFPQPNLFQDISFNQQATGQLNLPEIYHFSLFQRFARQFAIMGDIAWTRWNTLQTIPIVFQNAGTPPETLQLKYQDTLRYAVGFEWYATKNLTLRLGFAYDQTPIPSAEFRTPRIPDSNKYLLSAGFRWSPFRFMDIDLGYAHAFIQDPMVNYTDNMGHNVRGEFDSAINIVGAAVTFRWGGPRDAPSTVSQPAGKEVVGYRK